jgi:hypothetical protein
MSAGFFRAGCVVIHRFVGFAYRETANFGIVDILTGKRIQQPQRVAWHTFLIYVAACRHEFVWFLSEVPASKCMDPASYPQRENDKVSDALDSIDESERVFTMNAFEGAKGSTVLNGITGWGSSGRPKDAHRLGDSRRVRELDPELSRNFRC